MAMSAAERIGEQYIIEAEIGAGGMGMVYRGRDLRSGETVAIKRLKPEASYPELIERFKREADALRQLNHPNIVKVFGTIEQEHSYYIVMEHISGGDLNDLLKSGKHISINRILKIAIELADALTRAHYLKIIHRDLKPANVLLASDGTPRLTDFGVAHIGSQERMTGTGTAVGTLDYLPPESINGDPVDARADIWAFGVLLFEMLTGKRPFTGQNATHTVTNILTQATPDLENLREDTPLPLVDLVYRMLDKDRDARIPSVRLIGAELEGIISGRPISTSTVTTPIVHNSPSTQAFATPTPTTGKIRHNLPAQTTPFVGREAEVTEMRKLINDDAVRLVTIVAQGGMGKTRLSLEIAEQCTTHTNHSTLYHFTNGVYFVPLAPLENPANIVSTIAEEVGYQFQQDERSPKQQLLDYLSEKSMLLVMDNFEHLLAGVSIVGEILQAAPQVKILATSRERLNISGENIFNLEGMDFPQWETPEDALEYSAMKLFMQGAKRARPDFELTPEDLPFIARICRMVLGLPLGILLAAAWVEMLSPKEIADEIGKSLDFLESEQRDLPERHRSMRAVFDYSWNLLGESEREPFIKMSVFKGGFTREAAQAVAGANLRVLMSLVNKSLLRRDPNSGRYEIHELLRQYAELRLVEAGLMDEALLAHSCYYGDYMLSLEPDMMNAKLPATIKIIEVEMDNLRAALKYSVEGCCLDELGKPLQTITIYYQAVSRFREGIETFNWMEDVLVKKGVSEDDAILWRVRVRKAFVMSHYGEYEAAKQIAQRAQAYFEQHHRSDELVLSYLAFCYADMMQGDYASARKYGQQAVVIYGKMNNQWGLMNGLFDLGYVEFLAGNYDESRRIYQDGLAYGEQSGIPTVLKAYGLNNLGEVNHAIGEEQEAKALFIQSHEIFASLNNKFGMAFTHNNLGKVAHTLGEYDMALACNTEAFELNQELGSRPGMADALNRLGGVQYSLGDFDTGLKYHHDALSIYRQIGNPKGIADSLMLLSISSVARGDYEAAKGFVNESLRLRREMGNTADVVDSLLMGGLHRTIAGDFDGALAYFDEAQAIIEEGLVPSWFEGQLQAFRTTWALQSDNYQLALELAQGLLPRSGEVSPWYQMTGYMSLGFANLGLGNFGEGVDYLRQAVHIAQELSTTDWMVFCMTGLAISYGLQKDAKQGVAYTSFCIHHPALQPFMKQQGLKFMHDMLADKLSPNEFNDAMEQGKSLSLETAYAALVL